MLTKPSKAGTLESNDIYIMLQPDDKLTIELESTVIEQFGDDIKEVIKSVLDEHGIKNAYVKANDKGALDYTIKARMISAIKRGM